MYTPPHQLRSGTAYGTAGYAAGPQYNPNAAPKIRANSMMAPSRNYPAPPGGHRNYAPPPPMNNNRPPPPVYNPNMAPPPPAGGWNPPPMNNNNNFYPPPSANNQNQAPRPPPPSYNQYQPPPPNNSAFMQPQPVPNFGGNQQPPPNSNVAGIDASAPPPPTAPDSNSVGGDDVNEAESPTPTEETKECVVCLTEKPSHVCVPCGHLCMCGDCAPQLDTCPLWTSLHVW